MTGRWTRIRAVRSRVVLLPVVAVLAVAALFGLRTALQRPDTSSVAGSVAGSATGSAGHVEVDSEAVAGSRSALEGLVVAERVHGGYRRELFAAGRVDSGRCSTRELVLMVERVAGVVVGCEVVDGAWVDWYSAGAPVLAEPSAVEVDHLVPLAHAWQAGAWAWPPRRRMAFANDVATPATLTVVSAAQNEAKGAAPPEVWQPRNRDARCRYAVDWITVKAVWKLTVTAAERDTLTLMLDRCPGGSHREAGS